MCEMMLIDIYLFNFWRYWFAICFWLPTLCLLSLFCLQLYFHA